MDINERIAAVITKDDFIKFLRALIDNNTNSPEEWEGKTISDYLESIQSWIEDMEGYYENNNLEIPSNVDWGFFATVFYVGKIYE